MKKVILLGLLLSSMAFAALKDGVYTASTEKDSRGYSTKLELTVKDGKVVKALIDDVMDNGTKKRDGADAMKRWEDRMKTSYAPAAAELEKKIIEKQTAEIDSVAGATTLSGSFKKLAGVLLKNAETGNTTPVVVK